MSLTKIVEELKQVKQFAEENVETGPRETMSGRRGRKNQAIERLKTLKRDYRIRLLESAAFIVVTGDKRNEFTTSATENFKCFSANPSEFYEDLSNRIPASLYQGKESMVNLFDIIGRHLEDKCMELDLQEYNTFLFKQEYYVSVKNKSDLVNLLTRAINDQMGPEIVGIQAVTSVVNKAIERGHTAGITPIILSTDNEALAVALEGSLRRLKTRGVSLVIAGKGTKTLRGVNGAISVKDPTNENVEKTLKTISDSIKSK